MRIPTMAKLLTKVKGAHSVLFALLLTVCLTTNAVSSSTSKAAHVSLTTEWHSSLLSEASEFWAALDPSLFWKLLDIADPVDNSHQSQLAEVMRVSESAEFALETYESLLTTAIAIRYYSPKVQASSTVGASLLEDGGHSTEISSFVTVCDSILTTVDQLSDALTNLRRYDCESRPSSLGHKYSAQTRNSGSTQFTLYGTPGTCKPFHQLLASSARKGDVEYIFRHFVSDVDEIALQGYGADFSIKSMEYKAVDDSQPDTVDGDSSQDQDEEIPEDAVNGFMFRSLEQRHPELKDNLRAFREDLLADSDEGPLKKWQIKDLGVQASQRILEAKDPLQKLRDLSQNLPTAARSLTRLRADGSLKESFERNKDEFGIAPGTNVVAFNGRQVDVDSVDPFLLFDQLRDEITFRDALGELSEGNAYLVDDLMAVTPPTTAMRMDVRFKGILWLNNIERDGNYHDWEPSIQSILDAGGNMAFIRKNIYHVVAVVDLGTEEGLQTMGQMGFFIHRGAPLRLGVVLLTGGATSSDSNIMLDDILSPEEIEELGLREVVRDGGDDGEAGGFSGTMARAFAYLAERSMHDALMFIDRIAYYTNWEPYSESLAQNAFSQAASRSVWDEVKRGDHGKMVKKHSKWLSKRGIHKQMVFLNGVIAEDGIHNIFASVWPEQELVQKAVRQSDLTDSSDVFDVMSETYATTKNYNEEILSPSPSFTSSNWSNGLKYIVSSEGVKDSETVSQLLIVDLRRNIGVESLAELLKRVSQSSYVGTRSAFLLHFEGHQLGDGNENFISSVVGWLLDNRGLRDPENLATMRKLLEIELASGLSVSSLESKLKVLEFLDIPDDAMGHDPSDEWLCGHLCSDDISFQPTTAVWVVNGRLITTKKALTSIEIQLLESVEASRWGESVAKVLKDHGIASADRTADLANRLGLREESIGTRLSVPVGHPDTVIKSDNDAASGLRVDAVLNPLSTESQKIVPILMTLRDQFNVHVQVTLSPVDALSELPLNNFYRYVFSTRMAFNSEGMMVNTPKAVFAGLPESVTLTLNLHTPEQWLVGQKRAAVDFDNLKLGDAASVTGSNVVRAEYGLEHILLTGHCSDGTFEQPRGLQLVLSNHKAFGFSDSDVSDTLVMSNLGYFQLKSNPGQFALRIKEGRSSDIFHIVSVKDAKSKKPMVETNLVLDSFGEKILSLEVARNPGKEKESLLVTDENKDDAGVWDSISGLWKDKDPKEKDTIHVFSLASGHLYERFLKIMMLSVVSNTESPVKFWFLSNFLSPKFKDSMPALAQTYGFEYELVTYKWPAWLHKQTEKQRIIWGYKILFLDVLFPLDLTKVIFVDADQVVRADIRELWDLDLKGAPLAYTPFCDSNKDTEGFRFWKGGFWEQHLRGKPYHISALYVVDLERFRRYAAGDQLRIVYNNLSKDPNSLANLDQDLPNYAQHMVPIHSLPQEWLWCETWCDQTSKTRAKTIDLCNNPLTKEPKLDMARRIISEWVHLDEMASSVSTQSSKERQQQQQQQHDDTEL